MNSSSDIVEKIDSLLSHAEIVHRVEVKPDVELRVYRTSNPRAAEVAVRTFELSGLDDGAEEALAALFSAHLDQPQRLSDVWSAMRDYLKQKQAPELYVVTEPEKPYSEPRRLYVLYVSPNRDDALRRLERRHGVIQHYFEQFESVKKTVEAAALQVIAASNMQGSLSLSRLDKAVQMFNDGVVDETLSLTNFGQEGFESLETLMDQYETELIDIAEALRRTANRLGQLCVSE